MSITSDLSGAQQKATEIKSAVSVLGTTSTINNDTWWCDKFSEWPW